MSAVRGNRMTLAAVRRHRLISSSVRCAALALLGAAACTQRASSKPPRPPNPALQLNGRLGADAVRALSPVINVGSDAVVVVLNSSVVFTCEDLGRQLRQVRRATSIRSLKMVVFTTARDSESVTAWLAWERIPGAVVTSERAIALAGGTAVPAPAVLLMHGPDIIRTGIAHPTRATNLRLVSFVSELNLH